MATNSCRDFKLSFYFGWCLQEEPNSVTKHILLQMHTIDCMANLKICQIRQVLVEDGLFLEWYSIDGCFISLSLPPIFLLLPINDLDVPDYIENIVPVSSYWSRTEFRLAIKMIIELLTSGVFRGREKTYCFLLMKNGGVCSPLRPRFFFCVCVY